MVAGSASAQPGRTHEITIAASGDLLIHWPVAARALRFGGGRWYDFLPMLARVRPIVRSADLAFCHVETPMGAGALSGYPRFNAPGSLALAIRWTGWDACDTASNHTVDRGQAGVDATLGSLDRWHVSHTGSARSPAEASRILILPVQGLKVAFLAYTYGTNGLPLPHPWSVNLLDARRIVADGLRARRAGADLVIVNLHAGDEYSHAPSAQQLATARAIFAHRAADVVVGQHVHVVQPIRRLDGHYVVFGEGNLLSNQTTSCCPLGTQDGLIALIRVRWVEGEQPRVVGVDYVPTWVEHPDYVVQPVGYALARGAGAALAGEYRASYWRTVRWAGVAKTIKPLPGPGSFR